MKLPSNAQTPERQVIKAIPVTELEMVTGVYERSPLEEVMRAFAFAKPIEQGGPVASESELSSALLGFSIDLTQLASMSGTIDSDVIRTGFELIASKMNRIAQDKIGGRPVTTSRLGALLGQRPRQGRNVITGFTEQEWNKQFKPEIDSLPLDQDHIQESYDFIYTIFYGFALAPFSHVQQASRWA